MKRRMWVVFCAVQLVGCIFASYGTVYSESAFVRSSWLAGFLLLLPGNLPATMLAQKLINVHAALVFFPVAIGSTPFSDRVFIALGNAARRKPLTPPRRYGIALIGTIIVFAIANVINFLRPVSCYDCFSPYGVPFTLYREGGFAGGGDLYGQVWLQTPEWLFSSRHSWEVLGSGLL